MANRNLKMAFPGPFFDKRAIATHRNSIPIEKYNIMQAYDGHANNLIHMSQGKVDIPLTRKVAPAYEDGVSSLAVRGAANPNPRYISNEICKQDTSVPNSVGLSDMVWGWGQFIDHEIDLTSTQSGEGAEVANIIAPGDDPNLPNATIKFTRSIYEDGSNPRQQVNKISAYIDATNVYGSNCVRANELRMHDGSGKLKTQLSLNSEVILPDNTNLEMAHLDSQSVNDMLMAGDERANENHLLTAIHTLFVREHNRQCDELVSRNSEWENNDDKIFHEARMRCIAIMQAITYNEYLPKIIGVMPTYTGYKQTVNASIMNLFSTAAYRFGHSMLSADLLRKFNSGPDETVRLRDAFFNPAFLRTEGVDSFLAGAMNQVMQEIDNHVIEDVRSFLFGPPGGDMMLDLAALNIQRGRDHGLPDYNTCRVACGLRKHFRFSDITSNVDLASKLSTVYNGKINTVDPWVGGLCEDHVAGSQVGEFLQKVLRLQFVALRDGDRFYYENDPRITDEEKNTLSGTTLADVIRRNTNIDSVADDVFMV